MIEGWEIKSVFPIQDNYVFPVSAERNVNYHTQYYAVR